MREFSHVRVWSSNGYQMIHETKFESCLRKSSSVSLNFSAGTEGIGVVRMGHDVHAAVLHQRTVHPSIHDVEGKPLAVSWETWSASNRRSEMDVQKRVHQERSSSCKESIRSFINMIPLLGKGRKAKTETVSDVRESTEELWTFDSPSRINTSLNDKLKSFLLLEKAMFCF